MKGLFNVRFISKVVRICKAAGLIFLFSFSGKEDSKEINPPYYDIEKIIKEKYDSRAVFKWDQYEELLKKLSGEKFRIVQMKDMTSTVDSSKVIIGMRHDVDLNPFKALEMAKIEHQYGICATYFLLSTSEYNGKFINSRLVRSQGIKYLYKELYGTGAEIGIHNDLLTVMIQYHIDPFKFNRSELSFYKSLKIPIYGTASHGSPIAKKTVPNYQVFSDFAKKDSVYYEGKKYPIGKYSLEKYGYKYEAYFIDHNLYFSDSGGKWNDPEGFQGIMKKLDLCKPGDRVEMLIHPDWWGKK